ncbi:MAG: hypothetical protein PHQ80_02365, partial [Candidatus ainarchaeum sp.]|nr:hypothetical protein [Candidatus ainarchaeum sp.]
MVERKNPVLWGPEFKERGDACQAIATAAHRIKIGVTDEFTRTIAEGKSMILGQFELAQRYPQLEEPWLEATLLAFSKLPPENDAEWEMKKMADCRAADLRDAEAFELRQLKDIGKDTRGVVSLIDEAMAVLSSSREKGAEEKALEGEIAELERRLNAIGASKPKEAAIAEGDGWDDVEEELDREIAADTAESLENTIAGKRAELEEMAGKAEAEWNEKLAQEESLLEGYTELLVEQVGGATEYANSRSAAARREAAKVLIDARDVHSLINLCYNEMDPDARGMAFRNAVEAARKPTDDPQVSMSMRLNREDRSMLLRMVEDTDEAIASLAWELAEWMLDNGKLDGEQIDYLEMRAKDAEGNEVAARVLSWRACEWIDTAGRCEEGGARVPALVHVLEGIWAGLELDGDQKELLLEFTEDTMPEVSVQAWLVALELCRKGELASGQVAELVRRAKRIEDGGKMISTMAALFDMVPRGSIEAPVEWQLVMAAAGHPDEERMGRGLARAMEMLMGGKLTPEQVEDFLVLVDSMESDRIGGRNARIFACVGQAVKPEELTERAARMLHVERVS